MPQPPPHPIPSQQTNRLTEMEMSSLEQHSHHWLHQKWQIPVQLVTKMSSKLQHFCFSARHFIAIAPMHNKIFSLPIHVFEPLSVMPGGQRHCTPNGVCMQLWLQPPFNLLQWSSSENGEALFIIISIKKLGKLFTGSTFYSWALRSFRC